MKDPIPSLRRRCRRLTYLTGLLFAALVVTGWLYVGAKREAQSYQNLSTLLLRQCGVRQ